MNHTVSGTISYRYSDYIGSIEEEVRLSPNRKGEIKT